MTTTETMPELATAPAVRSRSRGFVDQVRAHAATLLPPGVVPARFIVLDDLPRLPNGKTDRSRLPAPESLAEESPAADQGLHRPVTSTEKLVAGVWGDILGRTTIDVDTAFTELGGSSLSMMQMAARVKNLTGRAVDVRRFMGAPTVRALAADVDGTSPVEAVHDLQAQADEEAMRHDAVLPDDVVPLGRREVSGSCEHVLLTGGTGYTGAFLLRELLDRGTAQVTVLARGAGPQDVVARVLQNLDQYGLGRDGDEPRLTGVVGDVARPFLGLSPTDRRLIADETDVIIHNAADSRWTTSYDQAKVTNILGSLEVLRLARDGGNTPVHYIGSTGSLPTTSGTPTWTESANDVLDGVRGGYRQTKWVSDRLMHSARERGLRVSVHRPGALVGAQDTGACSTETFINHLIRGWIQMGRAMRYDLQVEMVPIDHCASVVAHLALERPEPATYHVLGTAPVQMDEVLDHLLAYGYDLEVLDYASWHAELVDLAHRGEDNDLIPYLPLFGSEAPGVEIGLAGSHPTFEDSNLRSAIAGTDLGQRPLDREVMRTYLDYFVETGFLPPPTTAHPSEGQNP